jgi:hypothetical protein
MLIELDNPQDIEHFEKAIKVINYLGTLESATQSKEGENPMTDINPHVPLTPPVEGAIWNDAAYQWFLDGKPVKAVEITQDACDTGQ